MALLNDWEVESGHTSVVSDKTTSLLSKIPPNKFEKKPPNSSPSYQQRLPPPQSMSPAPMNKSITLHLSTPPSIFTTHPDVSKTLEVSPTSKIDQTSSPGASFAMQTLDWSMSCGAMTGQRAAVSTPKSVPTITPVQDLPTAARTVQSAVSLGSSSMTLHPEKTLTKSISLNEPRVSSKHVSLMSEHSGASGISNPPCSTMTSTMKSSLKMVTLSEKPSSSLQNLKRISEPSSQEFQTLSSVQTQGVETDDNTDETSSPNNGNANSNDDDEWEVLNETLVYADCVGAVESDLMEPGKSVLLVDFDSDNPLIQIGPAIFQGAYEDCLGTDLIFEKHQPNSETPGVGEDSAQPSSSTGPKPTIEIFASRSKTLTRAHFTYAGKTTKNLILNRVFLKPKQ